MKTMTRIFNVLAMLCAAALFVLLLWFLYVTLTGELSAYEAIVRICTVARGWWRALAPGS